MSALCQVCGRTTTTQCGQCETTLYCGQACADTDWTQGGHSHLCCDVTEALPLARRLFMESAMPTISAEHRAEADELVESLLLEHCAEQYFIQNPHLIDVYLEPETPLIGAYAGDSAAAAAAEEDRLIDELAEIRGEALALLEEMHLRDIHEYPGVYGLDAIGQEFGQRSEVWQRDYALLENRFTEMLSVAAQKVRNAASAAGKAIAKGARAAVEAAKSAGRTIASGAQKAVAKGKELAGQARAAISRGAKSAAQKLRNAKNKAFATAKNFRTNVSANFKKASERRSRNRKSNRSRSSSSSGSDDGDSYETRGRSRTRDDEASYRSTSQEKRRKSEERRLKRKVKDDARRRQKQAQEDADRQVADANAARRQAEQDAAAARQQAKLAQDTVYRSPVTTTTPTVVVSPASPNHMVQPGQFRTKEDRLNARIVNTQKVINGYKAEIGKLEKDNARDKDEKKRELDDLYSKLAAAKVTYDVAMKQLDQIRPQTSMNTTVFWK